MKRYAFPFEPTEHDGSTGMTLREWYATFAPEPTEAELKFQYEQDRVRNPHGDSYKPKRRRYARDYRRVEIRIRRRNGCCIGSERRY